MSKLSKDLRQKDKVKGKCDYCHKRRLIGKETLFCDECLYEWNRVTDKYFDGNHFTILEVACGDE